MSSNSSEIPSISAKEARRRRLEVCESMSSIGSGSDCYYYDSAEEEAREVLLRERQQQMGPFNLDDDSSEDTKDELELGLGAAAWTLDEDLEEFVKYINKKDSPASPWPKQTPTPTEPNSGHVSPVKIQSRPSSPLKAVRTLASPVRFFSKDAETPYPSELNRTTDSPLAKKMEEEGCQDNTVCLIPVPEIPGAIRIPNSPLFFNPESDDKELLGYHSDDNSYQSYESDDEIFECDDVNEDSRPQSP